jgi:sulfonate transport system permease protein
MRTDTITVKPIPDGADRAERGSAAAALRRGLRSSAGAVRPLQGLLVPCLVLAAWELLTRTGTVKPYFLPAPERVVETFVDLLAGQYLLADIAVSLATVLYGFLIGGSIGFAAGISAGLSKTVDRLFNPFLNALRQVPPIAWLPLVVLWVGAGDLGKTVVIAKAVFFPVFLNTLQGIRSVGREHVEVARVLGFGRGRLLRHVVLPSALPSILVGVRYGVGLAWMMIVSAEMLSGRRGLGFLLLQSQDLLQTDVVFVVITVIGFIGYALDAGLRKLGGRLTGWKREFAG